MQETLQITAREAVERLLAGDQKYIDAKCAASVTFQKR